MLMLLRRVREWLTGYPADAERALLFTKARLITGRCPTLVKRLMTGNIAVRFGHDDVYFSCVVAHDSCHVYSYDKTSITDFMVFNKRRWRLLTKLGRPLDEMTFEQATNYCVHALDLLFG